MGCFFFLSCSFQNSLWVLMERLKCLQILLISAKTWSTLPHSSETHVPAGLSDVRNTQNRTFTKAAKYYLYTRDKYLGNYSVQFLYWLSISIVESNIYDSLSCEVKGCFNITVPLHAADDLWITMIWLWNGPPLWRQIFPWHHVNCAELRSYFTSNDNDLLPWLSCGPFTTDQTSRITYFLLSHNNFLMLKITEIMWHHYYHF